MAASDLELRNLILKTVTDRASENGGSVTRADLRFTLPGGREVKVVDQSRGIRNPRDMDATLSVISSPDGPYADREVDGGLFHYAYRANSDEGDNTKLRRAFELQTPIILLRKIEPGVFVPYVPTYVVDDLRERREFLLAIDEAVRFLPASLPEDAPQRRYVDRLVRQRLHQAEFRGRVIRAYRTRCAICSLAHGSLLDAAHIIEDADVAGLPLVTNGLSLCKIHHAAFDVNLLGITPDFVVRIDTALLAETDGPMLRHGLQEMDGRTLVLPVDKKQRPDRDRLATRYRRFLAAG